MKMKNKLIVLSGVIILGLSNVVSAQSKKEQIEGLSSRLDSFNRVLDEEKKNALSQSAELKTTTLRFQNKVDSLDKLLANTKQELKKSEKDLNDSKTELQAKETEMSKRTVQQKALEDRISELTNKNGQMNIQLADANREIEGLKGKLKGLEDSLSKINQQMKALQTTTTINSQRVENKNLIPEEIEYDGKPSLDYEYLKKVVALDHYLENDDQNKYIRMKIQGKECTLKMDQSKTNRGVRVYSNQQLQVIFYDIVFGECAGEGMQKIKGKMKIQSPTEENVLNFEGMDDLYSSKKCQ
jgi:chromosome segregation ATPase